MANKKHLEILQQGVVAWNNWRKNNPRIKPNLSGAVIQGVDFTSDPCFAGDVELNLKFADLRKSDFNGSILLGADLQEAHLEEAYLMRTDLSYANISRACLAGANLYKANLRNSDFTFADLRRAHLYGADLSRTNFDCADLENADLRNSTLVETKFTGNTNLNGCWVYGISVWRIELDKSIQQSDLLITDIHEPKLTVDNLEVAQFVYLLLNNEKLRNVIDTIGQKGVLILGRFIVDRKAVLDAIRDKLRELGFVPMMFDFEKSTQRDFTETIKTLAGLSRFIIADITNPKSSPLELQATMPDYMIPFVPIIQEDEEPFSMFQDLQNKYGDWVLDVLRYDSVDSLLKVLDKAVVKPALKKADELLIKKAEGIRDRHVKDYM